MSWNNRKETTKFQNELKKMVVYWKSNGMSQEQIREMIAFETDKFHKKRNQYEYGEEVPLYNRDADGNEELIHHEALIPTEMA